MSSFEPYLGVFWRSRELTFGEFATRVRQFLEGLRELHSDFVNWYVLGDRMSDEKTLGVDLEHFDELMLERGWDMAAPKDRFTHLDINGVPTVNSKVTVGWSLDLVTEPEAQRTPDYVHASIFAGATNPRLLNRVSLKARDQESSLLDPAVSERVFRYMIEFWNPDRGLVTEQSYRDALDGPEQLGWLNYRADSSFADFLPDGVPCESLGGGVLFRIGDGRVLSDADTAEVQIGLQIQQAILARR